MVEVIPASESDSSLVLENEMVLNVMGWKVETTIMKLNIADDPANLMCCSKESTEQSIGYVTPDRIQARF